MKEKIKKFINIKRIGKVGLALTSLFCYTNNLQNAIILEHFQLFGEVGNILGVLCAFERF